MKIGCEKYVSCDKWPDGNPVDPRDVSFVATYCDIVELNRHFAGETFDYIIVQHVVEEVPEYRAALKAISETIDEREGLAILEIPFVSRDRHARHAENRYGNVWTFSRHRLLEELSLYFRQIDEWQLEETGTEIEIFACSK